MTTIGCGTEKENLVRVSELKEFSIRNKTIEIVLLKSFISKLTCDSLKHLIYANAFLCKVNKSDDTIIVFNICEKAPLFLIPDYAGPRGLVIDSSKVVRSYPGEILTIIDDQALNRYQYIIADIDNYIDG